MARTLGIEEEFLLFGTSSSELVGAGDEVVASAGAHGSGRFTHELKREQAELGTDPHTSAHDLAAELRVRRGALAAGAQEQGTRLVALATSPLDARHTATPDGRYERMMQVFGRIGRIQLTCAMHVHVGIGSPDEGVAVIDRIRAWLPVLVALSANSPYFAGEDTGYASYRTQLWGQWPTAGPTEPFGSHEEYQRACDDLIASGAALDDGMIYFDARLSATYPTVEVRVADVCPYADDAITVAALIRALVTTAAEDWSRGEPPPDVRAGLLKAAAWQAARFGLGGRLFDLGTRRLHDAWDEVDRLVEHVRPALADAGDAALVAEGLASIRRRGNGAALQRATFERSGDLASVIDAVAQVTA